jgi:NTP pyrophosphatase (non-canonical NTP hydrolase)
MELILEYTAFGGSLLSTWFYGTKGRKGPITGLITSLLFIAFGLYTGIYAAVIANIIFAGIHYINLRKIILTDEEAIKKKIKDSYDEIANRAYDASLAAGWWNDIETNEPLDRDQLTPTKLLLAISEITEAMEGHRKDLMDDKLPHRPMIECELADAVIRIGDLGKALNLDVGGAIAEKMEFNKTRPDHKVENRRKHSGKKY